MAYELFTEVMLAVDFPAHGLRAGDLATMVDHDPAEDMEDGYSLEILNALGDATAVITVPESSITPLNAATILSARPLSVTSKE